MYDIGSSLPIFQYNSNKFSFVFEKMFENPDGLIKSDELKAE